MRGYVQNTLTTVVKSFARERRPFLGRKDGYVNKSAVISIMQTHEEGVSHARLTAILLCELKEHYGDQLPAHFATLKHIKNRVMQIFRENPTIFYEEDGLWNLKKEGL